VRFPRGVEARVAGLGEDGRRVLDFGKLDVRAFLHGTGYAPLPPYIKRAKRDEAARPGDIARYQTVFARKEGAIAAPTAGLHFTPGVLGALGAGGSTSDASPSTWAWPPSNPSGSVSSRTTRCSMSPIP